MKDTWIIQSSGINDSECNKLVDACIQTNTPFGDVGLIPFTNKLIGIERARIGDLFYGSTKMVQLLLNTEFRQGIFYNDNFRVDVWESNRDDMLNMSTYTSLREFLMLDETLFVRPVEDLKSFSGEVVEDKKEWYDRISHGILSLDTPVAYSEPVNIMEEYRVFIVNGNPVTGSRYRRNNQLSVKRMDTDQLFLCKTFTERWLPHKNCVIDIAVTSQGNRVIEFNCLNCSGFYNSDVRKIIEAFDNLK